MLLREAVFGIRLSFTNVNIDPWSISSYNYHIGSVNVDYSPTQVTIQLPIVGIKFYSIFGLSSNSTFHIKNWSSGQSNEFDVVSSAQGQISFSAQTGPAWRVSVTKKNI